MNWPMVIFGMELAVLLIILDKPVLPIAIGLYLPFSLTIPIILGGVVHFAVDRAIEQRYEIVKGATEDEKTKTKKLEKVKERIHNKGVLFASGLIAGEALMGIILAVFVVLDIPLAIVGNPMVPLGFIFFLALAGILWWMGNKELGETGIE
jgi:uncharacterized oligopeptide transporter (OPT) family protein